MPEHLKERREVPEDGSRSVVGGGSNLGLESRPPDDVGRSPGLAGSEKRAVMLGLPPLADGHPRFGAEADHSGENGNVTVTVSLLGKERRHCQVELSGHD